MLSIFQQNKHTFYKKILSLTFGGFTYGKNIYTCIIIYNNKVVTFAQWFVTLFTFLWHWFLGHFLVNNPYLKLPNKKQYFSFINFTYRYKNQPIPITLFPNEHNFNARNINDFTGIYFSPCHKWHTSALAITAYICHV